MEPVKSKWEDDEAAEPVGKESSSPLPKSSGNDANEGNSAGTRNKESDDSDTDGEIEEKE